MNLTNTIRILILFSIIGIVAVVASCKSNKYLYKKSPTNLAELHSGFNAIELSPVIRESDDTSITIVATGHLYQLFKFPLVYESFVNTIKEQDPDYIFILGDWVYNNTQEEWDIFFSYFNDLRDKLYFSPGNHDLNYHYERYVGKRDNQFEADQRYLENVGYRYKLLKDNMANYVFLNMNDSMHRVVSYLESIKPKLDKKKPSILLTSQCIWHNTYQEPDDVTTWTQKPFRHEEFVPYIKNYDYLIHGDWNINYYRGYWPEEDGPFQVMMVGNRMSNDTLFITRLEVKRDTIISKPIYVPIPGESKWFK